MSERVFGVGEKVILKREYAKYYSDGLNKKPLIVESCDDSEIKLADVNGKIEVYGAGINHHFEHYGKHVNNEVYDLVENNIIKSFQAVLEDGRIIHMSCLN